MHSSNVCAYDLRKKNSQLEIFRRLLLTCIYNIWPPNMMKFPCWNFSLKIKK